MHTKTLKTAAYWLTTGILAFDFGVGGVFHLTRSPQVMSAMAHLGYPAYFVTVLGVWKVLAGLALLTPHFPRLKEWAYAGIFFDLTGAALSLVAVGDGLGKALIPLAFLGFTWASYTLRPRSRTWQSASSAERAESTLATATP